MTPAAQPHKQMSLIEELVSWGVGTVGYILVFGIPCFIMLGLWIVAPAVLILYYGVDSHMWISTMAQLYPDEMGSISLFVAMVVSATVFTAKTYWGCASWQPKN